MKRNENFWSYRLHKLGTPKVLRTDGRTDRRTDGQTDGQTDGRPDGRSGPTTRPAFAKGTQVKIWEPQHDRAMFTCVITKCIIKGMHCIYP